MDRHPIIQVERVNSKWYHFDITFRINLKAILKFIILLAISAGVIFVGYWLMKGAVALAGLIWEGLYWLSRQGLWLLGAVVLAFLIWALTKVNWCNIKVGANIWKYILRILALIVAILCLIFCFRSCNKEDKIIDDELFAKTKRFLEEHLNKDLFIFAEFQDNMIVATCGLSLLKTLPQCCDNGVYGYVCNVFTLEKFRSKGIQTNLMAHLMAFVENKKIKRLLLSSDNPTAIHIYQKFGFKKDDWGYKWMAIF